MSSTPSKPVDIGSPVRSLRDIGDEEATDAPNVRQRRQQYGTPPAGTTIPRFRGTPGNLTPIVLGSPARSLPPAEYFRNTPRPVTPIERGPLRVVSTADVTKIPSQALPELSEEERMRVLQRHLVSRDQRFGDEPSKSQGPSRVPSFYPEDSERPSNKSSRASSVYNREEDDEVDVFPLPFSTPGGDVTHPVYKWQERARRNARPRATSLIEPSISAGPAFENIHEPGGFRRNYVRLRAEEQGLDEPRVTENFIDFLFLYGHFAGEDLEESDEEDSEVDEVSGPMPVAAGSSQPARTQSILRRGDTQRTVGPTLIADIRPRPQHTEIDEETPLLVAESTVSRLRKRSQSRSRRNTRSSHGPHHGDATVVQAILMLLKAFIGTGILFLGKAFYNGGMLFSAVTLVIIALVSLLSFLLLFETKTVVPGSFGDIGGALYGKAMRQTILASIAVSQLGFVCAYTIFIAENLQAFVMAVTKCKTLLPIQTLIFSQLIVFLPLSLIRNLAKLSMTALVADVFILIGIVYIASNEVAVIAQKGVADIKWFNGKDFPLLIGTAVFSFEGIGLIIPIADSMREPRKFPAVLTGVMFFLILLFGGAGMLGYAAYGPEIKTVVITNLPQDKPFVQVVQFLYSLAILLSAPLQLFPALRIMENRLFKRKSGREDLGVKWTKNAFRALVILVCYLISWAGAKDLDKFVSFVGSVACVPLCFVYPAMLHLRAVAKTRRQIVVDWLMIIFGSGAAIFTTVQTIKLMATSGGASDPRSGHCPNPSEGSLLTW